MAADPKRKRPDDYIALGLSRGFEWIGPEVTTSHSKTGWRCSFGHKWQASYSNLKNRGCPYCSNKARKAPEDYHLLASERGLIWIGPYPGGVFKSTEWRCIRCGKVHSKSYHYVKKTTGCSICVKPVYHPEKTILQNQRRRARMRELPDTFTHEQYELMMSYWGEVCAVTLESGKLSLDHWIPITAPNCPGTTAQNIIPMLSSLNKGKCNRDPLEWLERKFGHDQALLIAARIEAYFEWVRNQTE